jgi:general nucleoside transport system ATP-binding protein
MMMPKTTPQSTSGAPQTGDRFACVGLSKAYPGVRACDDVSLRVAAGEIHALLGENGAGKSTLVKMIYGLVQPDAGEMTVDGVVHRPTSPAMARRAGVGMVFQHFSLFDALTVTDNIALGLAEWVPRPLLEQRIVTTASAYGLDVSPHRRAGTLSAGERQRVEIIRCLLQSPQMIILDEPTSVLTNQEADRLFQTLRVLAGEGRSILYISHKLDEIRALCSRATILRAGRVVGDTDPRTETAKSLAELMLGGAFTSVSRASTEAAGIRLRVQGLSLAADTPFGVSLEDISFDVKPGEIVGIAGVAGNGQRELMAALIGERLVSPRHSIQTDDQDAGHLGPIQRRDLGMAFVPEERLGHGAAPHLSLLENTLLSARKHEALAPRGIIDRTRAEVFADRIINAFGVKTTGAIALASSLSGGNLQKFLVGREILQRPKVLIAAQPTWGVDAGAASVIHRQLLALAAGGAAIVLISQDLDELLRLSDRVAVLAGGRLSKARPVASLTSEAIGLEMGGASATSAETLHDPA